MYTGCGAAEVGESDISARAGDAGGQVGGGRSANHPDTVQAEFVFAGCGAAGVGESVVSASTGD